MYLMSLLMRNGRESIQRPQVSLCVFIARNNLIVMKKNEKKKLDKKYE